VSPEPESRPPDSAWRRARAKLALRIHLTIFVVFNTGFWLPALGLHGFWACRRPLTELARAEQNHGATDSNYR